MIEDPNPVPVGLTTTGILGKRYLARFIDQLAILLCAVPFVLLGAFVAAQTSVDEQTFQVLTIILVGVVTILYGALLESSSWQATVGKKLTGLKVYGQAGERLSFGRAAARAAVKDVPFILLQQLPLIGGAATLGWLLAHVMVLQRSPLCQAIHDWLCKTWVAAPDETIQLRLGE
jgi:uncharacterized RDD family membrane protein YckC